MLDQNTDRMWYVIGAVIVGAAIIFLANRSLPNLFASVGESFKGQTDNAVAVVDSIHVGHEVVGDDVFITPVELELSDNSSYALGTFEGGVGTLRILNNAPNRLNNRYIFYEENSDIIRADVFNQVGTTYRLSVFVRVQAESGHVRFSFDTRRTTWGYDGPWSPNPSSPQRNIHESEAALQGDTAGEWVELVTYLTIIENGGQFGVLGFDLETLAIGSVVEYRDISMAPVE